MTKRQFIRKLTDRGWVRTAPAFRAARGVFYTYTQDRRLMSVWLPPGKHFAQINTISSRRLLSYIDASRVIARVS